MMHVWQFRNVSQGMKGEAEVMLMIHDEVLFPLPDACITHRFGMDGWGKMVIDLREMPELTSLPPTLQT